MRDGGRLTVFLVILVNFRHEFAIQNCLVIALRQIADTAKERARELGQWMESEVVDDGKGPIRSIEAEQQPYQCLRVLPKLLDVDCNIALAPSMLDHGRHDGRSKNAVSRGYYLLQWQDGT